MNQTDYSTQQFPPPVVVERGGYAWFANRGIGRPLIDRTREEHP